MTIQLTIPDMMCGACANTITQAILAIDPAAKVEADPPSKQVKIDTQKPEAEVRSVITTAGYTIA